MKVINSDIVYQTIYQKLLEVNTQVKREVIEFFEKYEGPFKNEILENFNVAKQEGIPLCQDTGIVEFFVWKGFDVLTDKPISEILNLAVRDTYTTNGFRKSVVDDPLFSRKNTGDNTPCVIHFFETEKPTLEIWMIIKGGGSENLSQLYMFQPSEKYEVIKETIVKHIETNGPNACPPIKIGIGIGGTSEEAMVLSKLALIDVNVEEYNSKVVRYRNFEEDLLRQLQNLKIGVQGLGFGNGVYNVKAYGYPTHIATLPVAISVDCFLLRSARVVIDND